MFDSTVLKYVKPSLMPISSFIRGWMLYYLIWRKDEKKHEAPEAEDSIVRPLPSPRAAEPRASGTRVRVKSPVTPPVCLGCRPHRVCVLLTSTGSD